MESKANWAGDVDTYVRFIPRQGGELTANGAVGLKKFCAPSGWHTQRLCDGRGAGRICEAVNSR
jgi:hypothetical protein